MTAEKKPPPLVLRGLGASCCGRRFLFLASRSRRSVKAGDRLTRKEEEGGERGTFAWRRARSTTTTCLGVVAPDAALGERRGGASPTTRAAPHEDQGRPLQRETERGGAELLASWCVASGVKTKRSLFLSFSSSSCETGERERGGERQQEDVLYSDHSLQLSAQLSPAASVVSDVL